MVLSANSAACSQQRREVRRKEGPVRVGRTVQSAPPSTGTSLQPGPEGAAGWKGRPGHAAHWQPLHGDPPTASAWQFLKPAPPAG